MRRSVASPLPGSNSLRAAAEVLSRCCRSRRTRSDSALPRRTPLNCQMAAIVPVLRLPGNVEQRCEEPVHHRAGGSRLGDGGSESRRSTSIAQWRWSSTRRWTGPASITRISDDFIGAVQLAAQRLDVDRPGRRASRKPDHRGPTVSRGRRGIDPARHGTGRAGTARGFRALARVLYRHRPKIPQRIVRPAGKRCIMRRDPQRLTFSLEQFGR